MNKSFNDESFFRDQLEKLTNQAKLSKARTEQLEKENLALKKSLFELSTRFNALATDSRVSSSFTLFEPYDQVPDEHQIPESLSMAELGKTGKAGKYFQFKTDLRGHSGAVYNIQFSKDGKLLASGSFDKSVRIWDAVSLKEVGCLKKHGLNVSDLDWSRDSKTLLSGAYDSTCKVWSVETGKLSETFDTDGFVQCVQFDPSSKFFLIGR